MNEAKKLRVGLIGCGNIANAHLQAYLKQEDVEVVAGADLVPGKAKAFFEKYGLKDVKCDYADGHALLEDPSLKLDAVSVCTYNATHAECAIDALEHGINVLLEKPFTVTLDEAVKVCETERKSGKILSVGFQPRFDENMMMIRKICQSGQLGKIYYIQTGGGRRRGIPFNDGNSFIRKETAGLGALADIGCYSLDMVLNAVGYPKPLTVSGYTSNYFGKDKNYSGYQKNGDCSDIFGVDDFSSAFIRLEGDIVVDFRISWAMNMDTSGDTLILGTKGGLRIPSTECWNGSVGGDLTLYHEIDGEQVQTTIPKKNPPNDAPSLWDKKIRLFLDAVINHSESPVPSHQILYNQAILDGIARSAKLGREVEINL